MLEKYLLTFIQALKAAYHKGNYLHRDVSTGNVMIDKNGRGILNDWDHSVKVPRSGNKHAYRTVSAHNSALKDYH